MVPYFRVVAELASHPPVSRFLNVIKQGHEAVVHMKLLVAMEKSKPRVVRDEIDFGLLVASEHEHILHDATRVPSAHAGQLKDVSMEMDRMYVVTGVAHADAVPLALFAHETRWA